MPQLPTLAAFEHEPQRFALALGDVGEPDVHDVNADVGEHASELVLVLRRDRDAWHLLAIAQRVVVDADLVRRRELQVVAEAGRVAGELLEWLLQIYRFVQAMTPPSRPGAFLPGACAPTAPGRPCAAARS